jgi:glycosyltransferase involved in cell wall biosynthesis
VKESLPTIAERRREHGERIEARLDDLTRGEPRQWGLEGARSAWKRLPLPTGFRAAATSLFYSLSPKARRFVEEEAAGLGRRALLPGPAGAVAPGRLVVSGFLSDVTGIGRAGRMSVEVLARLGLNPEPHDLRTEPGGPASPHVGGVWLAHCNAPEAAEYLLNAPKPPEAYRVGYWAWELPELPRHWARTASLFHELWAPSRFVADAIDRAVGGLGLEVPVRVAPHPYPDMSRARRRRSIFGLEEGVFVFLCMCDVRSSVSRKNPLAAIHAFQRAFTRARKDVQLVVKVVAADPGDTSLDELKRLTAGWPNIRLLIQNLSDARADDLIASADAFVSLHRSEGFGLSIAQAMAAGRPVVTTGWSGNLDFCGDGALLAPYRLVPVKDASQIYDEGDQVWAEPDIDAAAALMRGLSEDQAGARDLGRRARRTVRERLPDGYDVAHWAPWLELRR